MLSYRDTDRTTFQFDRKHQSEGSARTECMEGKFTAISNRTSVCGEGQSSCEGHSGRWRIFEILYEAQVLIERRRPHIYPLTGYPLTG